MPTLRLESILAQYEKRQIEAFESGHTYRDYQGEVIKSIVARLQAIESELATLKAKVAK